MMQWLRRSFIIAIHGGVLAFLIFFTMAVQTLGQEPQTGVRVVLDGSESNFTTQSLPPTDFTVLPSVTSSTLGAGIQVLRLRIFCFDAFTGQIVNNCNVVVTHQPRSLSGGHSHTSGTRPKGTFEPSSGNTGTAGLPTVFTSPEVSGIVDTTISGTAPNGTPLLPGTFTIGVQIPALEALAAGINYELLGVTAVHPDSHYGTPTMNGALSGLADGYALAFPGFRLPINDMSLTAGGLFDLGAAWVKPHASHRFGNDADLNLVPVRQRRRLRQLITAAGLTVIPEGTETHWHVRQ